MKKIKQNTQINKSTTYDDTLSSGATLESGSELLEDDLTQHFASTTTEMPT